MTDRTELRPAETVAESVPTRHEAPDVVELRRLLAAYRAASGLAPIVDAWYAVARAALAALPALLDAAGERGALRRRLVAVEMLVEDALRHGYDLDPQAIASALASALDATPGGE